MRLLYLSCHSILEHDEIKLLHELGHEVFSPGAYWTPGTGGAGMRPPLPQIVYDEELVEKWNAHERVYPERDGKGYLTKDIVDYFDAVIVMHMPAWVSGNWEAIKHKTVIWRTIGQSIASTEASLFPYRKQGLRVVRYSPRERSIPGFIGEDALIRFYKDPNIYKDWIGSRTRVITFAQDMQNRGTACNYKLFEQVTRPFPRALFGPKNHQPGLGMGKVSFERLLQEMRENRVYFYTGTHPASYTLNFIEAQMTGIPIVAIGAEKGNAAHLRDHNLYEIPDIIQDGVNGFISDKPAVLMARVKDLIKSRDLAKRISAKGRDTAVRFFGKEIIKAQWKNYLEGIE